MKYLSLILLILSGFISGCNYLTLETYIEGRVNLPNGSPSVGGQGQLCVQVTFDKVKSNHCKTIITDNSGQYSVKIKDEIERLSKNPSEITDVKFFLKIQDRTYPIERSINITNSESANHVELNFINPEGYATGAGIELKNAIKNAEAKSVTFSYDQAIYDYAATNLRQLTPLDVMALIENLNFNTTSDKILLEYVQTNRNELTNKEIIMLSKMAYWSFNSDKILNSLKIKL